MEIKLFTAECELECLCGWAGVLLVPDLFTEDGITYGDWFCPECDEGYQGQIKLWNGGSND